MIARLLLALALVVVCAAALVLSLPYLLSSQIVREQVAAQITELTGRPVTLRGNQALRIFPNLSVELSDVVIEGNVPGTANALVVADTLRGSVRTLPLLFGRIELSSFEMTRPTIRLLRTGDGQSNWQIDGTDLVSAVEPGGLVGAGLAVGRFRIIDGTLQLVDEVQGINETLTSANLSLTWPNSSTRAVIGGSLIWRGEAVEVSASLDQPSALLQAGSVSGVLVSLQGAPVRLRFDGTVSPGAQAMPWQVSGSLSVATPSLRRSAAWLGAQVGAGSTFGTFRLDAAMNMVGLTMDLTEATVSLDGNDGEGVLTLDLNGHATAGGQRGRPSLQGTLDIERLDLSAYLDTMRPTTTAQAPGDWRFVPVPDVFASPVDIDLRFATRQVLTSRLALGETAGSVLLTGERMLLGIGEAQAYGGTFSATLTLDQADGRLGAGLDLSASAIRLGPLLTALQETPRLTGTLRTQALLSGEGETLAQLMETMSGDARIEVSDGVVSGVDLDALAARFVDGSFDLATFELAGETALEALSADLYASNGYVQAREVAMRTQRVSVTMSGQSQVAGRTLALRGATAINAANETLVVPFEVRGTWGNPLIMPDLSALER